MPRIVNEQAQQEIWNEILQRLDTKVDKVEGKTQTSNDYTIADQEKQNGIDEHANNYSLPVAGENMLGGVRTTSTVTSSNGYTPTPIIGGVPYYQNTDTTYTEATVSASGLMSAADKAKLDGIGDNVQNYVLPLAGKNQLGGVQTTSTVTSTSGLTPSPIIDGVPYYKDTNTTYTTMKPATANTNGSAGLVPAPTVGNQSKFLRADATWQSVMTSLATASATTKGGVKISNSFSVENDILYLNAITNAEIDAMMAS